MENESIWRSTLGSLPERVACFFLKNLKLPKKSLKIEIFYIENDKKEGGFINGNRN